MDIYPLIEFIFKTFLIVLLINMSIKVIIGHYHNSKMTVNTCLMREFFHGIEKLADPRLKDGLDDKMDEIRKQCFPRKGD